MRAWIRHFRETRFFRLKLALTRWKRDRLVRTKVIGITGSSTKSTTSAILRTILSSQHRVSFNSFDNRITSIARAIRKTPADSEFLVLEIAAGATPQIAEMAGLARPDIAIVTMVEIEHYAVYRSKDAIAQEKGNLVAALPRDGLAILNAEDEVVMGLAGRTDARIVTFGRIDGVDYQAKDISFDAEAGLRMRIAGKGQSVDIRSQLFGKHFYLPILAAVACALELGISPEVISEAVATFNGLASRCSLIRIDHGPTFICDTVKSPNHSLTLPMDALADVECSRKTIVIGQIADYAGNPRPKYSAAIQYAASVAQRVFLVGPTSRKGTFKSDRQEVEFGRFSSLSDLADYLKQTAIPGEMILLKSSVNLHLERLAINFREPVRCWADDCGQKRDCISCGLYGIPFPQQPGGRQARKKLRARLRREGGVWEPDAATKAGVSGESPAHD